jgi:hypothetical protein
MEKQYLMVGEQFSYRNNRLTMINVWDQFTAIHSPAKFNFDMVFVCGPGWPQGEYDLNFKVKSSADETFELGTAKANIVNNKSIFNAIASNLNIVIAENSGNITFIVERNGQEIFEREYPVIYLYQLQRDITNQHGTQEATL